MEKTETPGPEHKKRKRKTKQTLTRAVPHIRLAEANAGKLEALDHLAAAFMALTQRYVTLFCLRDAAPDGYMDPIYETTLSERWQRVCMQQAAGIAKSWRTNRSNAHASFLRDRAAQAGKRRKRTRRPGAKNLCGTNGMCQNCA